MHMSIFVYGIWGDIRPHVVLGVELQKAIYLLLQPPFLVGLNQLDKLSDI